jgi:uncharacterized damage-inducible protein DinB
MPTITEWLLPEFDAEMASTRKVLAAVPEEKFDWRPHAKSFTMGRLAGHVAEIPGWVSRAICEDRFEVVPEAPTPNVRFIPTSQEQLMERFEACVKKAHEDLTAASDEALEEIWVMTKRGKEVMRMPRRSVIRTWALNHGIHHRAQLGVYLRLNDVKVPGVYGPSADEQ